MSVPREYSLIGRTEAVGHNIEPVGSTSSLVLCVPEDGGHARQLSDRLAMEKFDSTWMAIFDDESADLDAVHDDINAYDVTVAVWSAAADRSATYRKLLKRDRKKAVVIVNIDETHIEIDGLHAARVVAMDDLDACHRLIEIVAGRGTTNGSWFEWTIVNAPLRQAIAADVTVIACLGRFRGQDLEIAELASFNRILPPGEHTFVRVPTSVGMRDVLCMGGPPLKGLTYSSLFELSRQSVQIIADERSEARSIALPVWGPDLGLDESLAWKCVFGGAFVAIHQNAKRRGPRSFAIVEPSIRRYDDYIAEFSNGLSFPIDGASWADFGKQLDGKDFVFVAMPFKDKYLDEYELAISPAIHANNLVCQRLDREAFMGEIVPEIERRIGACSIFIALINELNPNVFLELGMAIAKGKATIIIAKEGLELPFDIKTHRVMYYANLTQLLKNLRDFIGALREAGQV